MGKVIHMQKTLQDVEMGDITSEPRNKINQDNDSHLHEALTSTGFTVAKKYLKAT